MKVATVGTLNALNFTVSVLEKEISVKTAIALAVRTTKEMRYAKKRFLKF